MSDVKRSQTHNKIKSKKWIEMSSFSTVFSQEILDWIHSLPEVLHARQRLDALATESGTIYFTIPLTESIRESLHATFGLQLPSSLLSIPMRWIKGDTSPHIDQGPSSFDDTYLVYLTSSTGELLLGETSYAISENTGYTFQEGLSHETIGTGEVPRLLMGPMSEQGVPVGGITYLIYFANEADALAQINAIDYNFTNYIVATVSGTSSWRIAQTVPSSPADSTVYSAGADLQPTYNGTSVFLYPAPEGTCCPGQLQLQGVDYVTQADIIAGNIYQGDPRRQFSSYDAYYRLLMSLATRRQ